MLENLGKIDIIVRNSNYKVQFIIAVNNLASSLREEIGGDIPVEDSLEHQHNKTSEQLKAQQQKESDDQKKQQKENEVYKENRGVY
jgi:hypothetical protein